ncbi:conserved hypothetical protein [Thermoanaerobacter mathranii subsp. mathranii str. A3]|jgi:hypothetical protein|uniref:Uncharacterized protein n=1 Tax=Thermoanaerobacter mathranii subsp. mathranii (strain DSM 11426 / CCUG 53645 / CIP 108742 / A3) TaxID=583358 RepID=A0ABN3Z3C7_THEM3|nr:MULTISPECIES: hypothetical protein [Thermoanaerobacter]ADH61438.1 conserved hypothetical protein [Thermoanaerobacter mathranii subsp. mathranii str. A3]MBZ4656457.1 hypothetical protein [Thermoanaerobacter sp.]MDI3528540.1 hypothetical protein [Thermoanaerobacter sp.]
MDDIKKEFQKALETLKNAMELSFKEYKKNPSKKNEIIGLWEYTLGEFFQYFYKVSEKYDAKDLYKAITKVMIFGK